MLATNEFRKAAKSNPSGNCVEAGWFKSERSGAAGHCVECKFVKAERSGAAGHCVEVDVDSPHDDMVLLRDSKQNGLTDASRTIIEFTKADWQGYLDGLKLGFGAVPNPVVNPQEWLIIHGGRVLSFTYDEWNAFMDGVHKDEFSLNNALALSA